MSEQLTWMPAWRIRELVAGRQVSPVEVVDHFLGRIAEHNGTLKAFKVLDEKGARKQAKRAENEVRKSEARARTAEIQLREIIENMTEGLVCYDADQRLIRCNTKYRKFYG